MFQVISVKNAYESKYHSIHNFSGVLEMLLTILARRGASPDTYAEGFRIRDKIPAYGENSGEKLIYDRLFSVKELSDYYSTVSDNAIGL